MNIYQELYSTLNNKLQFLSIKEIEHNIAQEGQRIKKKLSTIMGISFSMWIITGFITALSNTQSFYIFSPVFVMSIFVFLICGKIDIRIDKHNTFPRFFKRYHHYKNQLFNTKSSGTNSLKDLDTQLEVLSAIEDILNSLPSNGHLAILAKQEFLILKERLVTQDYTKAYASVERTYTWIQQLEKNIQEEDNRHLLLKNLDESLINFRKDNNKANTLEKEVNAQYKNIL
jgi:uncharacterized protein YacL